MRARAKRAKVFRGAQAGFAKGAGIRRRGGALGDIPAGRLICRANPNSECFRERVVRGVTAALGERLKMLCASSPLPLSSSERDWPPGGEGSLFCLGHFPRVGPR